MAFLLVMMITKVMAVLMVSTSLTSAGRVVPPGQVNIESLYASSVYRRNAYLDVPPVDIVDGITRVHLCLLQCLNAKQPCHSFNYNPQNGTCVLLGRSLCEDESFELTPDPGTHYYDLMVNPDLERKFLDDSYCQRLGKCASKCYPRKPLLVEEKMTRKDALAYCEQLYRKLAQPSKTSEQAFYGEYARKFASQLAKANNQTKNLKGFELFWIGMTDEEVESLWQYDDGTPVSEAFSAWAVSQPDNGGTFGIGSSPENCAVMDVSKDNNWLDVNCDLELFFFCA